MTEHRPPRKYLNDAELMRWYGETRPAIPDRSEPDSSPTLSPAVCVSCGTEFKRTNRRTPFCSEFCKSACRLIRICRRWMRTESMRQDKEYTYSLRVRMAFLNSSYLGEGGYTRNLSPEIRALIWERDNGKCVKCGKPGAQVDHIHGDSDEPENLQLLCLDCHHGKTNAAMRAVSPQESLILGLMWAEIAERIDAAIPIRPCDNEQTWGKFWNRYPDLPPAASEYEQIEPQATYSDLRRQIDEYARSLNRAR